MGADFGSFRPDPTHPDYGEFPLKAWIGFDIEDEGDGTAVAHLDVADHMRNPNGVVHGGVLFTLVDTSMGAAAMSVLEEDRICASIEISLRFIRPVLGGRVDARTEVVRAGRRVVHLRSEVTSDGEIAAIASGSFAVIPLGDR